ncbi:MAG: TetR/AcrR family transcriptional regulator [Bacteroidia bacterium]|nr:TetR/AcrR family transcriptional regulator [Bacteroidia bacterium]MDW8235815.1 helix-turn-helix domain-containing protein [Bacteroidia bacterium]
MGSAADRIKEAAIREFARYGYEGARLERIARTAGVHNAQIHYYFRNKRALYEAVRSALTPPSLEGVLAPLRDISLPLPERVKKFYELFGGVAPTLNIGEEGSFVLPPLVLSPVALELPEWVEALHSAQQIGMIRRLPMRFILAQQWSLALLPLWFKEPSESWEEYYQQQAPRLFWESIKAV